MRRPISVGALLGAVAGLDGRARLGIFCVNGPTLEIRHREKRIHERNELILRRIHRHHCPPYIADVEHSLVPKGHLLIPILAHPTQTFLVHHRQRPRQMTIPQCRSFPFPPLFFEVSCWIEGL